MSSNNPDLLGAVNEFKKGGWVIALLGSMGMLARLILAKEKFGFIVWIRKIIAGGIVGVIAYFALYGADIEPIYKSVIYSISGSFAPEIWTFLSKKIKKKLR